MILTIGDLVAHPASSVRRLDSSFGSILDSTVGAAGAAEGPQRVGRSGRGGGVGGQQLKSYNSSVDALAPAPEDCSSPALARLYRLPVTQTP